MTAGSARESGLKLSNEQVDNPTVIKAKVLLPALACLYTVTEKNNNKKPQNRSNTPSRDSKDVVFKIPVKCLRLFSQVWNHSYIFLKLHKVCIVKYKH